jgi:hypothetical protein
VQLRCDNQSAIHLIKQNTAGRTGRSKHIDVQFHFLKDAFQRGDLEVEFVETANQAADEFTKQLPGPALVRVTAKLMGGWFVCLYTVMPEGVCDSGALRWCQYDCMGACMHIAFHADVARVRVDSADKCAQTEM